MDKLCFNKQSIFLGFFFIIVMACFFACSGQNAGLNDKNLKESFDNKSIQITKTADKSGNLKSLPDRFQPFSGVVHKNLPHIDKSGQKKSSVKKNYGKSKSHKNNRAQKHHYADLSLMEKANTIKSSKPGDIVFNFDNADLYEVIRVMADILKINYIVEPNVRGRVTIHTAGKLRKDELFAVFFQILEANGLTAVREGELYKIGKLKDAPRMPLTTIVGKRRAPGSKGERVIMQIIPLEYISAQEMTKLLTPFISSEGTIVSHADSNTLLIVDKDVNIVKALELVKAFDIDLFEKVEHRLYHLKYVEADALSKVLKEILSAYGINEKKGTKFIGIKRLNMLFVISSDSGVFKKIEELISELDVQSADVEPRIFVYSVKNGEAEELATLLTTVFSQSGNNERKKIVQANKKKENLGRYTPPNPFANTQMAKNKKRARKSGPEQVQEGTGTLKGEIKITPDKIRNALIIEAIPSDYKIVEGILRKIDILPRQVLIEVVIAEISLDGKDSLGVEWQYKKGSGGSLSSSLLSGSMGGGGLNFTIGQTDRWSVSLATLSSKSKLNILSAPVILASDNKEASINISDQIPVASAEYIYDSGQNGVTQTNIQYRDTGIILSVTPHINDRGLVSMDINQEVSEQGEGVSVGGKDYPSFRERRVSTTLTVKHGQTIVLGGLMREKETKGTSGVPLLSDIPWIGFLFGKKSNEYVKTELILLITPRVIVDLEDVDEVTHEFKAKVDHIRNQNRIHEDSFIDLMNK